METKAKGQEETSTQYITRLGEVPRQNRPKKKPSPEPETTETADEQPNDLPEHPQDDFDDHIEHPTSHVSGTKDQETETPSSHDTADTTGTNASDAETIGSTTHDLNPTTNDVEPNHDAMTDDDTARATGASVGAMTTDDPNAKATTHPKRRRFEYKQPEPQDQVETPASHEPQDSHPTRTPKRKRARPDKRQTPAPKKSGGSLLTVPTAIVTFLISIVLALAAMLLAKSMLSGPNTQPQTQTAPESTPTPPEPDPEPAPVESPTPEPNADVTTTVNPNQVATKCLPSVVSIATTGPKGASIASGVIIDDQGHIITNWHVIEDAEQITIDSDDKTADARLIGGDQSSDIAVIQADISELDGAVPIEIGDSTKLEVGDWVMTLGSPLGLDKSVSAGIVSGLSRNTVMSTSEDSTLYVNLIQVDAAINGGNSGGALVNSQGQLVGINTLYANGSGEEAFAGIGFAIPGNFATDIARKVIAGETITHAYIGLSCSTVNEQSAQAAGLSVTSGAYVVETVPDAPGAQAGITIGDVITKIGDAPISSADDYILAIRSHQPGEVIDIVLDRKGEEITAQVALGSDEKVPQAPATTI